MAKRGERVFVDTNVIIEAHRTGCWMGIVKNYSVNTVTTCYQETQMGGNWLPGYIGVPEEHIKGFVEIKDVTDLQRAHLALIPGSDSLDPGERDLLACLLGDKGIWVVSGPDKAALRVLHSAGFLDRTIALEELAEALGMRPKLRANYTKKWHRHFCSQLKLGVI